MMLLFSCEIESIGKKKSIRNFTLAVITCLIHTKYLHFSNINPYRRSYFIIIYSGSQFIIDMLRHLNFLFIINCNFGCCHNYFVVLFIHIHTNLISSSCYFSLCSKDIFKVIFDRRCKIYLQVKNVLFYFLYE